MTPALLQRCASHHLRSVDYRAQPKAIPRRMARPSRCTQPDAANNGTAAARASRSGGNSLAKSPRHVFRILYLLWRP
jgi:hypothetical protein